MVVGLLTGEVSAEELQKDYWRKACCMRKDPSGRSLDRKIPCNRTSGEVIPDEVRIPDERILYMRAPDGRVSE